MAFPELNLSDHEVGRLCALGAAICWAFALVMFKRSGEHTPPLALNLFKNTVGLILFAMTMLFFGEDLSGLDAHSRTDIVILLASGVLGIAVADTLFFASLNLIGVGSMAVVECLYSPMILAMSWYMLSEHLGVWQFCGAGLVIGGVLIASRQHGHTDRTTMQISLGLLIGAASMLFMTFGIVWAKPILEEMSLLWGTSLRLLAGTVSLFIYGMLTRHRPSIIAAFRPTARWRLTIPGGILGTYICLLLWIGGFKWAQASDAAILNQTSTIFALILATFVLKEQLTRRKVIAVGTAMIGVALVLVGSRSTTDVGPAPPVAIMHEIRAHETGSHTDSAGFDLSASAEDLVLQGT